MRPGNHAGTELGQGGDSDRGRSGRQGGGLGQRGSGQGRADLFPGLRPGPRLRPGQRPALRPGPCLRLGPGGLDGRAPDRALSPLGHQLAPGPAHPGHRGHLDVLRFLGHVEQHVHGRSLADIAHPAHLQAFWERHLAVRRVGAFDAPERIGGRRDDRQPGVGSRAFHPHRNRNTVSEDCHRDPAVPEGCHCEPAVPDCHCEPTLVISRQVDRRRDRF